MPYTNMLTTYSCAASLFQQELPSSLIDVEKRARLVNEINAPLMQGNSSNTALAVNIMIIDLDNKKKDSRLDDITKTSLTYLTEEMDHMLRKNILLRLRTGCMEVVKAIRFRYVAGIRDGIVIEAPITHEYREALFSSLIDLLSKIDLVYAAGVESAPVYKKLLKEHYSFTGVPPNSIVRRYPNEYQKE
jgi:hypothetical protein